MNTDRTSLSVRILGKEYQVACPADERDALQDSAQLLDQNMREIRDSGKVVGLDRIAVMAALNIANELLIARNSDDRLDEETCARVLQLRKRVEATLEEGEQLEL